MRLCPNCGNQNDDTGKYCSCCGCSMDQARQGIPAEQLRPEMPVYDEQLQNRTPVQPLWVTEQYDLSSEIDIEKSLLYRSPDQSTDAADILSAAQKYAVNFDEYTPEVDDIDIFDEIADSASLIFSVMPFKSKKWVLAFVIGTLLTIIPLIYVSCSQQKMPTLDSLTSITTSWTTP